MYKIELRTPAGKLIKTKKYESIETFSKWKAVQEEKYEGVYNIICFQLINDKWQPCVEYEWWFKDALGEKECRIVPKPELSDKNGDPLKEVVDFYEGRLYKKEGVTNSVPGVWQKIE
jgi:hypothetical protein